MGEQLMPSTLEQRFFQMLRLRPIPAPEREYAFILEGTPDIQRRYVTPKTRKPRAWRFDCAWPDLKVAVEIDGGLFRPDGGRHNTRTDQEKLAAARALGWIVIHLTAPELRDSWTPLEIVTAVLEYRQRQSQ